MILTIVGAVFGLLAFRLAVVAAVRHYRERQRQRNWERIEQQIRELERWKADV